VQEEVIPRTIIDKRPEQFKMNLFLWSRAAVGQLIEQEYGVKLYGAASENTLHAVWLHTTKTSKRAYDIALKRYKPSWRVNTQP
jgi:hypothetical protein